MKTRFDETKLWITGKNEAVRISTMETRHLMNTVRMFATNPQRTVGIIISDIERYAPDHDTGTPWTSEKRSRQNIKKQSVFNITSMSTQEVVEYSLSSPLCQAMLTELESRGVNVQSFVRMLNAGCDAF